MPVSAKRDLPNLEDEDLLALCAIALEDRFPRGGIKALPPRFEERMRKSGLLQEANGPPRPGGGDLRTTQQFRQQILRQAARAGHLSGAIHLAEAALGQKSRAQDWRRILTGQLTPRSPGIGADPWLSAALRTSITEPFDAVWLEEVWGERSLTIGLHVLEEAQITLSPCSRLFDWLCTRQATDLLVPRAAQTLSTHAILSGRAELASALSENASAGARLGIAAAGALFEGRLGAARLLARRALAFRDEATARSPLLPLWLLLLQTGKDPSDVSTAARLLGRHNPGWLGSSLKLLRQLKRLMETPSLEPPRIALPKGSTAPAWEWILSGLLSVEFSEHVWTRQAFQQALVGKALEYSEHGYHWAARQVALIARELDRDATRAHLMQNAPGAGLDFPPEPGDLVRLPLAAPKWRRSLERLVQWEKEPEPPRHRHRIVWTVDLDHGCLTRPLIEEHRKGRGFVPGHRLELSDLSSANLDLPSEDQHVIRLIERSAQPEVEGLEGLVGHPRVRVGAASQRSATIGWGTYAVATRSESDSIVVEMTPRGLGVGLNVLSVGDSGLELVRVPEELAPVLDLLRDGLRVPREHEAEALDLLDSVGARLPIETRGAGREQDILAETTPCLRITRAFGAFLLELGVRPFGPEGRFYFVGGGPQLLHGRRRGQRVRIARDLAIEQERAEALLQSTPQLEALHRSGSDGCSWIVGEAELLELLARLPPGDELTLEWNETPPYRLAGVAGGAQLSAAIRPKRGWYLLRGKVAIDDVTELSLAELASLPSVAKGRFLRLPSGEFVELERRLARLLSLARIEGGELRLTRAQVLGLSKGPSPDWLELPAATALDLEAFERAWSMPSPAGLQATLRPYQLQGFQWLAAMSRLQLGVCLADDMGLGKTVEVLAFLLSLDRPTSALVIAPTSVCRGWLTEARRFAPSLDARPFDARRCTPRATRTAAEADRAQRSSLTVASYSELTQHQGIFLDQQWDVIVLDEAQFIKNARSERAEVCHRLQGRMRIALSGTPIENHLGDLFSLFHFLNPGLLGDYRTFQTFYQKPIERGVDPEASRELSQLIRPFVLRRTKGEVLQELPPITRVRKEIELGPEEALRYAALRREIQGRIKSHLVNSKVEVLAEITRLRRFCCHPRLVVPSASDRTSKLEEFLELAQELAENGHQTLVFSQYVDVLEIVRQRLNELGLRSLTLEGSTRRADREKRVDQFQAGEAEFFLISLKAGGFGLNLTRADYVIHLDPWWNPAVMAQATDRAHRLGQSRPVTVYEFMTKRTIEEDVYALHERKEKLATDTLEGGSGGLELSAEELRSWLSRALGEEPDSGFTA